MAKKKRKGFRWSIGVYDPYSDTQIAKVKNMDDSQFDICLKEFKKKFR